MPDGVGLVVQNPIADSAPGFGLAFPYWFGKNDDQELLAEASPEGGC